MRCFSIIALCLVAAAANAASIRDIRTCVRDGVKDKVDDLRTDIDARLKAISDSGDESAREAREEFKRKTEEFEQACTEPLDKAKAKYEDCVESADGFFDKAKCVVNAGRDLINDVIPIASKKTSELADSIKEIAVQFRKDNKGNFEDIREKGRQFAKDVVAVIRDCVRQ